MDLSPHGNVMIKRKAEPHRPHPHPSPEGARYDPRQFSTGVFEGCPQAGEGGDPDLSLLKNRDLPPPSYVPMTVGEVVNGLPGSLPVGRDNPRRPWTGQERPL